MSAFEPSKQPFEELYGTALTADEVAEMRSNLTGYIEILIAIDKEQ